MQTFEGIYTSYCDCVKVVRCLDYPAPPATWADVTEEVYDDDEGGMFTYLISRGVEELDAEDFTISAHFVTVAMKAIHRRILTVFHLQAPNRIQ